MTHVLFDTDVLIELLNKNATVGQEFRALSNAENFLFVSPVSVAELYHGIKPREESNLLAVLSLCTCTDVDHSIGKLAGEFLKQYSKSHAMEVADALVAATAVRHGYQLCTFNWKHYLMKDIQRYVIKR